jgi:leukemia factor-related protein
VQYVDLDEFLSENGIPVDGLPQSTVQQQQVIKQGSPLPEAARGLPQPHSLPHPAQTQQQRCGDPPGPPVLELVTTKRERSPTPSEPLSPDTLNPPSPADSSEDSLLFHCHLFHTLHHRILDLWCHMNIMQNLST